MPARNIESSASVALTTKIQHDLRVGPNIALPIHLADFFNKMDPKGTSAASFPALL
jgi:hypothetical protein